MKLIFSPKPEGSRFHMDEQVWSGLRASLVNYAAGDNEQRECLGRTLRKVNEVGVMEEGSADDPNVLYEFDPQGGEILFAMDEKKLLRKAWSDFSPKLPGRFLEVIKATEAKLVGKPLDLVRA